MTTTMDSKLEVHKFIFDLPSSQYHATPDTYSSSQFKDLLDDEDVFITKHIKKEIEREESAAFDVGTYFHTGVLEPEKLGEDCVVFPGKVRRGKEWDKFKEQHRGKAIVSQIQKDVAEGLVRAVKDSPIAQEYLDGESEVSLFTELLIHQGSIYAPYFGKVLGPDGWRDGQGKNLDRAFKLTVKVRADMLGETYVSDLKSTTGNARSNRAMREKVSYYNYDLSAALYLDMFSLLRPELAEFIWIFASKDLFNCKTYRASANNIRVGRAKYMRALIRMRDCAHNRWETPDYLDVLEPLGHELEYLKEREIDLL